MRSGGQERQRWRALSGAREFGLVYEEGVKQVGRLLVLYLFPGDDLARAVVASRKVGKAVTRNRAKRLLREALRSQVESRPGTATALRRRHLPDAPEGEGLWIVAVARARIVDAVIGDVTSELARLLEQSPPQGTGPAAPVGERGR